MEEEMQLLQRHNKKLRDDLNQTKFVLGTLIYRLSPELGVNNAAKLINDLAVINGGRNSPKEGE